MVWNSIRKCMNCVFIFYTENQLLQSQKQDFGELLEKIVKEQSPLQIIFHFHIS